MQSFLISRTMIGRLASRHRNQEGIMSRVRYGTSILRCASDKLLQASVVDDHIYLGSASYIRLTWTTMILMISIGAYHHDRLGLIGL